MMAGPNGVHGGIQNGVHGSAHGLGSLEAFDDLAEAFLGGPINSSAAGSVHVADVTEDDGDDLDGPGRTALSPVRVLLQGHLPGRASLWAGPAAQTMADQQGEAVLLIRLAGDELGDAQIDLVFPADRQGPSITPEASSSDFEAAVSAGLARAASVVLCVSGEDLASKQASLLLSVDDLIKAGRCEVRVLTGADDASCIAAYRLMKSVAEAISDRRGGPIDAAQTTGVSSTGGPSTAGQNAPHEQSPLMSVSLAGANPSKADEAFARMADAARQFLARALSRGPDVPKLIGMHSQCLHDRTTEHLVLESRLSWLRDQLAAWLETRPHAASDANVAASASDTPSSHTAMNKAATSSSQVSVVGRPVEWSGHLDVSTGDPIAQVKLVMDDRGVMRPADAPAGKPTEAQVKTNTVTERLAATSPTPPIKGLHVSPAASGTSTGQATSGMMFPGLTALSFRCPFEKSAILAVDEAGVLQVLVSHSEAGGGQSDVAAARQALAEATHRLITVAGWLSANSELLGLISGGKIVTAARPVLHLLTDHPASVRRLLDTEIRVHLVIDESKRKPGTIAIALN